MTNEEITGKILGMFSEDMDPESRRLLIKMYEVCSNKDWNDEPICSLLNVKSSFDIISERMSNLKSCNLMYADDDLYMNMENLNKIRKNSYEFECGTGRKKSILNKFQIELIEDYIMLQDCIRNYDDNNKVLKTRIMDLITEMEILLGVPITFPSKIPECVNKIIEESFKKRGGVSRGRWIKKNNWIIQWKNSYFNRWNK